MNSADAPTPPTRAHQEKTFLPFIPRRAKNALKDSFLKYPYWILANYVSRITARKFFGQTAEDAILQRYFPERVGTYIDIGGGHPIKFSNTYAFYRRGWRGICVDAIEFNVHLWKLMRPRDRAIHVCIGEKTESRPFWIFEPYGLSTADPQVAESVLTIPGVRLLEKRHVQSIPLSEIVPPMNSQQPCFMSVDVEGLDLSVLTTNDWGICHPRVICVENWNGNKRTTENFVERFLEKVGYKKVAFTGLSEIYVALDFLGR